jgi:ketosteroid isomerase-like protein
MNHRRSLLLAAATLPAAGCATRAPAPTPAEAQAQVRAAETSFADSMARRDFAAFGSHVADDAVFINGGDPLRGKVAILAYWQRFFSAPAAPFSWRPEIVELAGGGHLGYTEGPVLSPAGVAFARFYSTWQRQPDGGWKVVFDNGWTLCANPKATP